MIQDEPASGGCQHCWSHVRDGILFPVWTPLSASISSTPQLSIYTNEIRIIWHTLSVVPASASSHPQIGSSSDGGQNLALAQAARESQEKSERDRKKVIDVKNAYLGDLLTRPGDVMAGRGPAT